MGPLRRSKDKRCNDKDGFEDDFSGAIDRVTESAQERLMVDTIGRTGDIDDATDILVQLLARTVTVFPRLRSVQVGQRDWRGKFVMAEWMAQEQGILGTLLMRKLRPKRWCQSGSGAIYAHPSTRPVQSDRGHLPESFLAHVKIGEDFVFLWGTANHAYITQSERSHWWRRNLGSEGIINWNVDGIQSSFPACLGSPLHPGCGTQGAFEAKTRVVIYGSAGALQEDGDHGTVNKEEKLEELQKSVQAVCCREMEREDGTWQKSFLLQVLLMAVSARIVGVAGVPNRKDIGLGVSESGNAHWVAIGLFEYLLMYSG